MDTNNSPIMIQKFSTFTSTLIMETQLAKTLIEMNMYHDFTERKMFRIENPATRHKYTEFLSGQH